MKNTEKQPASVSQTNKPDNDFPGYPQYPPSEDIYAMGKRKPISIPKIQQPTKRQMSLKAAKHPMKKPSRTTFRVATSIFRAPSWMIRLKRLAVKMRKTIITVLVGIIIMILRKISNREGATCSAFF
jgi:hypothetical protein